MKIRRNRRRIFDSGSALSDLAFLLIIYFIVIAGFNINKGFLLNLPAKNSTRILQKEDILRFELDEGGHIVFNGRPVSIGEAEEKITAVLGRRPDPAVLLTISGHTAWQSVVSFVELTGRLKVASFSFRMKAAEAANNED
jgi:biopolymer transport protein ExbD